MSDQYRRDDDPLAYGGDYRQDRGSGKKPGSERSMFGDAFKKAKSKYDEYSSKPSQQQDFGYGSPAAGQQYGPPAQQQSQPWGQPPQPGSHQTYGNDPIQSYGSRPSNTSAYPGGPPPQPQSSAQKPDLASKLFGGLHGAIHSIGTDVAGMLGTQYQGQPSASQNQQGGQAKNRFDSFAAPKDSNQVKWYVDGCSYMWAISQALENARESIWILDWWLSPELYLRRPPAANEEWRLDRVLQRAAQRGVKVNIIVYKEVTQALTLSSSHTKHALEDLSPNIGVFRHPDHLPDRQTAHSSILSSFQGLKLDAAGATKLGSDALKGIYGLSDGVILYWAHHEKLCLIDGHIAFMGGLDLCYGRWDTNQHAIADAHPSDLNKIIFPGQDFNNARVMDFDNVANPFQNKLERTKSSRMGWSDISICLRGPCVQDLRHHFTDRWNFIYDEKYNVRKDTRYQRLPQIAGHFAGEGPQPVPGQQPSGSQSLQPGQYPPPPGNQGYQPPPWQAQPQSTTAFATSTSNVKPHSPQPGAYPPPPPGPPPTQSSSQYQQSYGGQQQQSSLPHSPQLSAIGQSNRPGQEMYNQTLQQTLSSTQPTQTTQNAYSPYGQSFSPPPNPTQSVSPGPTKYDSYGHQPTQPANPVQSPPPSQGGYGAQPQYTSQSQAAHADTAPYQSPYSQQPYSSTPQPSSSPHPQGSGGYDPYHQAHSSQSTPQPQQTYHAYHQDGQTQQSQQYNSSSQYPSGSTAELSGQQPGYTAYHQSTGTRGFGDDDQNYGDSYQQERASNPNHGRMGRYKDEGRRLGNELGAIGSMIQGKVEQKMPGQFFGGSASRPSSRGGPNMRCQLLRSCTKWSNGTPTEHSIQNAYIDVIEKSQHFVYIENQFFITATGDKQGPVKNQIGKAIVERIVRAARERTPYKVIVIMPAIPAFAGDFIDSASLGTRAICEFQYFSICRGGHSIMEEIQKAGVNPMDYIRFYNLRNYDRINFTPAQAQAQQQAGVNYETARIQYEDRLGAGYGGQPQAGTQPTGYQSNPAQQYQTAAQNAPTTSADRWDSVASCYMLHGEDIRNVPWTGPADAEIDAFVSEELYVHSKVIIADDQVVICGSANINDRSMLGNHDSEIALLIYDTTPQQSMMAGRPWQATRFAASLRRQLFRKHLGLLPAQDPRRPDANFEPVHSPNAYDWGSAEDNMVSDPLADTFQSFWNSRARTNTEVFRKAFRAVPDDYVRSWSEYKEFYEYYFAKAGGEAVGKDKGAKPSRVEYGHVVRDDFPGGVKELKDLLSKVKGTLVEMPLCFLQNEDIAKEGLELNALTEEVYT